MEKAGGAMDVAPVAARSVVKEILEGSSQVELLACRRALAIGGPVKSRLKRDLLNELLGYCIDGTCEKEICTALLANRSMSHLHSLLSRLRGLGCRVNVRRWSTRQDLVAAVINAEPGPQSKSSSMEPSAVGPCPGKRPAAEPPAPELQESTTLVAFESSADPGKLGRKLWKRWRKKWAKVCRKRQRKEKLACLPAVMQKVIEENPRITRGELRSIVGQQLGIALEGKNRLPFELELYKRQAPPLAQPRVRCRCRVATAAETKALAARPPTQP